MATYQESLHLKTAADGGMIDITAQVREHVRASGVSTGIAHIFNVGSTAAIASIEFEPGLQRDLPELLHRLIPPGRDYGHEQAWHDGNAHSHLQATWLGPEISVPVRSGEPVLGTWQQIIHLECDVRDRDREIVVTVVGD